VSLLCEEEHKLFAPLLRKVPTVQVERDHLIEDLSLTEQRSDLLDLWSHARELARLEAIAPINNDVAEHKDRITLSVLFDVVGERLELSVAHHGKEACGLVDLVLCHVVALLCWFKLLVLPDLSLHAASTIFTGGAALHMLPRFAALCGAARA
jgi:hypothetical protein